ncbi:MAG: hypothetical protein ACJ76F_11995 [Bacteroidia bacterium]
MKDSLKITGKGALLMLGSFFLAKLLMVFGFMVAACFAAVILGCIGPALFYDWRSGTASLMFNIFGTIFCGMIPAIKTDYGGFGTSSGTISVAEICNHPTSSIYTFSDAHVVNSLYGYEPIMGRRYKVGDLYAAPLVPANWKPGMEIKAWVLSDERNDRSWKKPYKGAVRRLKTEDAENAIADAVKDYRLKSSPDAITLYWCRNPSHTFFTEFQGGLLFTLICVLTSAVISLSTFKSDQPALKPKTSEPPQEEVTEIIAQRQNQPGKESSRETAINSYPKEEGKRTDKEKRKKRRH